MGFTTYGYQGEAVSSIDNEVPLYFAGANKQAILRVAPGAADSGTDVFADDLIQEHDGGKIARFGYGPASSPTYVLTVTRDGVEFEPSGLIYSPESSGAAGGANFTTGNVAMTSGSKVATCVANTWTADDVGKTIWVQGAGAASARLDAVIESFQSSSQVTLSVAAGTTVTTSTAFWGTDDTAAWNSALARLRATGGKLEPSGGVYIVGNLNASALFGCTVEARGRTTTVSGTSGINRGTMLLCKPGTTGTWIDNSGSGQMVWKGIQFGYSRQGDLAQPDNGFLIAAYAGTASENIWFDQCYISGTYLKNTALWNAIAIFGAIRSQFYNYNNGGSKAVAISASNWSDTTSAFGTVNSVAGWNATSSALFIGSEIHDQSGGTSSYPLYLDGLSQGTFIDCLMDSRNPYVQIGDLDTTSARLTRNVTFDHCRFNRYTAQPASVVLVDAAVLVPDLKIENCWFDAAAMVSTLANSGAGLAQPTIRNNFNHNAATGGAGSATNILNFSTSGSGNRLTGPAEIDCMGLLVTVNGGLDALVRLLRPGTINAGSGTDASHNLSSSGWGSVRFNGGLNDPSGNSWIAQGAVGSAVNMVRISNAASGSSPTIDTATSGGTNVGLDIAGKGTGVLRFIIGTGQFSVLDSGGSNALLNASGTTLTLGAAGSTLKFFGGTGSTKPTISGSRGGNAALASLLTAGATLGLWTDGTTA